MSDTSHMLPGLIEASQDGADFYTEAAETVSDKELKKLFKQMATVKSRFVQDMSAEVPAPSKPAKGGKVAKPDPAHAWIGDLRGTYQGLRNGMGKLGADQVGQLDLAESQLIERFQQVRFDKSASYVVRVHAMQYEGKVKPVHDLLRARKRTLGARGV